MFESLETEQEVLGCLLNYSDIAPLALIKLDSGCFMHPLHILIFNTISDLTSQGRIANPITVSAVLKHDPEFQGEQGYLAKLVTNVGLNSLNDCIELLSELKRKRLLKAVCDQALRDLESVTADEIVATLDEARIQAMSGMKIKTEREVMADLAEDLKRNDLPCSTGLKRLDAALEGGFYPRRAYGMIARKKMGKTMMASTIAKNIADNGYKVLFIAAEMGDKEIQERVACRMMDAYGNAFRSDYRNSDHFSQSFAKAYNSSTDNLLYAKSPGIRFDSLRQLIMAAKIKHKISGFILDYWQLVGGKQGKSSEREHLDTVAQWLADFCRDNNIWCLVMGQENQDGNSRGGEGIRLAFDMVFSICGEPEDSANRWLVMKDSRYTKWQDVGSEASPAYRISEKGTHIEELDTTGVKYSFSGETP